MKYILVIDTGTTSTRASVYNELGTVISMAQIKRNVYTPHVGYFEFDALEMWADAKNAMLRAVNEAGISSWDICSVAITGQRESLIVCERATGKPLYRGISWNDFRVNDICNELNANPENLMKMKQANGMLIMSTFVAPKMKWVLDNVPGIRERAEHGEIWMGTPDTWLIYKMTQNNKFVTETTYSTRTALINYNTMQWDDELLHMFNIPRSVLANNILPSDANFGMMTDVFENDIPIIGVFGDQNAATFGNLCLHTGDMRLSLGTSGNVVANIGNVPKVSNAITQITSLGWNYCGNTYLFETASTFCGDMINWLCDKLGIISSPSEINDLIASIDSTDGLRIVNSFSGFIAPEFNPNARGIMVGLSAAHDKRHIARAAVEAVMFELYELYTSMKEEFQRIYPSREFNRICVDGGVTKCTYAMQFLADILQHEIVVSCNKEATSTGVFYISGLANGFWKNTDEITSHLEQEPQYQTYSPKIDSGTRDTLLKEWKTAIKTAYHWAELQKGN